MQPMVNIALRAARRAGQIITRAADRTDELTIEEKAENDFVSEVDRQAEAAIVDTILKAYPDHGIIGEEGGAVESDSEFTWVIDPLDGTTNYLRGIPHHCTSIAVKRGNVLTHGIIVDHFRNEEFTATRGEGAQLNGKRIRVTSTAKLNGAIVHTGMPWAQQKQHGDVDAGIYRHFCDNAGAVRRMGSAALDLAYVAAGRIDVYVEIGVFEWDLAAGAIIVREAGGFVSDLAGGDRFLETGNVVATTPRLFKNVAQMVRNVVREHDDHDLAKG